MPKGRWSTDRVLNQVTAKPLTSQRRLIVLAALVAQSGRNWIVLIGIVESNPPRVT